MFTILNDFDVDFDMFCVLLIQAVKGSTKRNKITVTNIYQPPIQAPNSFISHDKSKSQNREYSRTGIILKNMQWSTF